MQSNDSSNSESANEHNTADGSLPQDAAISLNLVQARHLIRKGGGRRHLVASLQVGGTQKPADHPLSLCLVLDRSGSMSGAKLQIAKNVAQRVVAGLSDRDEIAMAMFDTHAEVLQRRLQATPDVRLGLMALISQIQVGGNTALHEGWLTGCRLLAGDVVDRSRVSHVVLLTDGQATDGITDPMLISSQVADIRDKCNIGTSTVGVGPDYQEDMLGFMAMAGSGHFIHVDGPRDMNEVDSSAQLEGALLGLVDALRKAVLYDVELDVVAQVKAKVDSQYWYRRRVRSHPVPEQRCSIQVGDLMAGEEQHIVLTLPFPAMDDAPCVKVRARVSWRNAAGERFKGAWQEVVYSYAEDSEYDADQRDPAAVHWIAQEQAREAQREAVRYSEMGRADLGIAALRRTAASLTPWAAADSTLASYATELSDLDHKLGKGKLTAMERKEMAMRHMLGSRGQTDFRPWSNDPFADGDQR